MRAALGALLAIAIVAAGCLGASEPDDANGAPSSFAMPALDVGSSAAAWPRLEADLLGCKTFNTFFIVDYDQTDAWLPPGFTPRDLAGFLFFTPVIYGQTLAHVAVLECEESPWGPVRVGMVGFFVHAPDIPEAGDAEFHFFNALQFSDAPALSGTLEDELGWPVQPLALQLMTEATGDTPLPVVPGAPSPDRAGGFQGESSGQGMFDLAAMAVYPQGFDEPPLLRFWHQLDAGLAYSEFPLPMRTVAAGPLYRCDVTPGSPLHAVVGEVDCGPATGDPFDSFGLVFPRHDLRDVTFASLPGRDASRPVSLG